MGVGGCDCDFVVWWFFVDEFWWCICDVVVVCDGWVWCCDDVDFWVYLFCVVFVYLLCGVGVELVGWCVCGECGVFVCCCEFCVWCCYDWCGCVVVWFLIGWCLVVVGLLWVWWYVVLCG